MRNSLLNRLSCWGGVEGVGFGAMYVKLCNVAVIVVNNSDHGKAITIVTSYIMMNIN